MNARLNDTAKTSMHFPTTGTHREISVVDDNNFGPSDIGAFGSYEKRQQLDGVAALCVYRYKSLSNCKVITPVEDAVETVIATNHSLRV